MTHRTREHVLEEESRRAFVAAIPPEWVVRDVNPDYGLDLVVDIFLDGRATGLSFSVQLKATDQENIGKALRSVRFRRDTASDYWQQTIPVLIVRYHAPTGQLYARWWHAYNPLAAPRLYRDDLDQEPPSTVGFVFGDEDRWDETMVPGIVKAVTSFRRFKSPDIELPVVFNVSAERGVEDEELQRQLLLIRSLLVQVSDVMLVRPGPPGPDVASAVVRAESTSVALGDVASVTLDLLGEPPTPEQAAANVACAAAMVLDQVGQANVAAQIASVCAAKSTLITDVNVASALAGAFYRSRRVLQAMDVIADLNERDDEGARLAAWVLHSAVLAKGDSLTPEEQQRAIVVARAIFEKRLGDGDHHAAASEAYNLGSALAGARNWAGAVEMFRRALALDPNYGLHAYFLRDTAASLFEAGEYEEAAEMAAEALRLEPRAQDEVLLADALMYCGEYLNAQRMLTSYLERRPDEPSDAIWRLKVRVLDHMRSLVGDAQDRDEDKAGILMEQVDPSDEALTSERAMAYAGDALQADALCGYAYHWLSVLRLSEDDDGNLEFSAAVDPAICAAVLGPWEASWWVNAIRMASAHGEPDGVMYDLMRCGMYKAGQDVVTGLLEADPPLQSQHLVLLDRAGHDLGAERGTRGFRLRMRAPDGSVRELIFGPDASNPGDDDVAPTG